MKKRLDFSFVYGKSLSDALLSAPHRVTECEPDELTAPLISLHYFAFLGYYDFETVTVAKWAELFTDAAKLEALPRFLSIAQVDTWIPARVRHLFKLLENNGQLVRQILNTLDFSKLSTKLFVYLLLAYNACDIIARIDRRKLLECQWREILGSYPELVRVVPTGVVTYSDDFQEYVTKLRTPSMIKRNHTNVCKRH